MENSPSSQEEIARNQQSTTAILGAESTFTSYQHRDLNVIHIGAALPPISGKLIKRIEQGHFIEMAELLPESLGQTATDDDQPAAPKPKRRPVSDIVEWLQCFETYIAIVSRKQPTRVIDLLGYQNLIIQAYQEYRGDRWLGYDRRFRLQAAATPSIRWAIADSTLWNIAFSGRAGVSRCSHCFSLSHQSGDCESLPSTHGEGMLYKYQPLRTSQYGERTSYNNKLPPTHPPRIVQPVCYSFNENPKPGCKHPNCRFDHSCYWCRHDPKISNKRHKAIYCPNRPPRP